MRPTMTKFKCVQMYKDYKFLGCLGIILNFSISSFLLVLLLLQEIHKYSEMKTFIFAGIILASAAVAQNSTQYGTVNSESRKERATLIVCSWCEHSRLRFRLPH